MYINDDFSMRIRPDLIQSGIAKLELNILGLVL